MKPISKFLLCLSVSISGLLLIIYNSLYVNNNEFLHIIGMVITVSLPIALSIIIKVETPLQSFSNVEGKEA